MGRHLLILGAGKSSAYLFKYLKEQAAVQSFTVTIADINLDKTLEYWSGVAAFRWVKLSIDNQELLRSEIAKAQVVVSMLPYHLHPKIARLCIEFKRHLVTASYVSDEMQQMNPEIQAAGLVFMNEIGLDPGLDHMSAMKIINKIRSDNGKMLLFESFTGGLVAPNSDTNLWNYKFTWNPRNVVIAGQGGAAKFIQEGTYKYIPYHKLFRRTEFLNIDGYGTFEVYANRDSLKYRKAYGLEDALTLYRGTMRRVGFSRAWNIFVQLGMTDDQYQIEDSLGMTYREFVNLFLPYSPTDSVELKLRHYLKIDQDDIIWGKLEELDLFSKKKTIPLVAATPAQILQHILEDSWTLKPTDQDMIVMYHKFGFEQNGVKKQIDAHMVVLGEDPYFTAMAKTVGLPVAIAAVEILNNKITKPGVQIPIDGAVYQPILDQLEDYKVVFKEIEVPYLGYNPDSVAST